MRGTLLLCRTCSKSGRSYKTSGRPCVATNRRAGIECGGPDGSRLFSSLTSRSKTPGDFAALSERAHMLRYYDAVGHTSEIHRGINSSMQDLTNRVALVTGASRGIGRGIAVALARAGADVAVNYRERADTANSVCAEIIGLGRKTVAVQADVSVAAEVRRMVAEVEARLGSVDILVNNAGISRPQKLEDITEKDWDEVLTINLESVFLVTQAVLGGMRARKWGRIINLSSVAAQTGGAVGPHYAASKAGMLGLTHYCASLLVHDGITVNAIAPAPEP
jgi:3-oxoacyl-[acyl-carrier protein] reductase